MGWLANNYIELFGAVTGILYVFLEIRQTIWLWPVGIVTSAVYIWVFFTSRIYADMTLQVYYLVISILGWYWWTKGRGVGNEANARTDKEKLPVSHVRHTTAIWLSVVFVLLFTFMWLVLSRFTDSPVPVRDAFITSLSVVATWMLARKIFEHWYLWIIVNFVSAVLFVARGLYPTVVLYIVYGVMSFAGLAAWKKTIHEK